jgi:hypothetical protein
MAVGSGELTDMVTNGAESGLKVFAQPAQFAAWHKRKPHLAGLADNSAGR